MKYISEVTYIKNLPIGSKFPRLKKNKREAIHKNLLSVLLCEGLYRESKQEGFASRILRGRGYNDTNMEVFL